MIDEAPASEQNPPVVAVDVPKRHVGELDGLEPGDAVRLVIEGRVIEVSQKEPDKNFQGFSGMLRVEMRRFRALKQSNAFEELLDDDE